MLCLLLIPVFTEMSLGAETSVVWMEADFPPGYILKGPDKGQGYEDIMTRILQENLRGYRHDRLLGNLARMNHEFKMKKNVCNVALFKTPERQKIMYFSIPSTFTLPNRLIIPAKNVAKFGGSEMVKLDEILKSGLRVGVSRGRSYGKNIDAVLKRYNTRKNLFVHSGKDVFQSLLKMMLADRLDCLLGPPEEAVYMAKKMSVEDQVASLTLKESTGNYDEWLGYVACSKTEWGNRFINKINRILLEKRPTTKYRGAYEKWLDRNSIPMYRKLYKEAFLTIHE